MVAEKLDRGKYRKRFGSYIRSRRTRMFPDISGTKFAQTIGITGPYLSNIERGKVDPPSEEIVKKLANKLDDDEYKLLSKAGYQNPVYAPIFKDLPNEAMHGLKLIDEGMNLIDDEITLYDILGFLVGITAAAEPKTFGDIFRHLGDVFDSLEDSEELTNEFYAIIQQGKDMLQNASTIKDLIPPSLISQEESED